MPINYILQIRNHNNTWGRIDKYRMVNFESYKDKWIIIKDFLQNINKGNK